MYNCRFVTEDGTTFRFGYPYGTVFDLYPLTEVDVAVSTSQGFQQVGTTIEAETVSGLSRTISGIFLSASKDLPERMLRCFAPGVHGKLYFNDTLYCECVVQKTPLISFANRKRAFSLMLYCRYPYWLTSEETVYMLGGYIPQFTLPVCYDTHTYGMRASEAFTNCVNNGMVQIPFELRFRCDAPVENYGLENVYTGEALRINDTLAIGEEVRCYRVNGRLKLEKTSDGITEDIFSALDESSTLFSAAVGDNVLRSIADSGVANLICYVMLQPAFVGVLDND